MEFMLLEKLAAHHLTSRIDVRDVIR
jgi:hypothetical protein